MLKVWVIHRISRIRVDYLGKAWLGPYAERYHFGNHTEVTRLSVVNKMCPFVTVVC